MNSIDILSHFPPWHTPRPVQVDILERTVAAFEAGKRFVVCEAPTGVGKSDYAVTLAGAYGATYVCTLTKQLQAQYLEDYEKIGAKELKGRTAFQCSRCGDNCEVGGHRYEEYPCGYEDYFTPDDRRIRACPYKVAKRIALRAPITICNYLSYIYNIRSDSGGERPLLVLDEAHTAEDTLMEVVSVEVDGSKLPIRVSHPLPAVGDVAGGFRWLEYFLVDAEVADPPRTDRGQIDLARLVAKALRAREYRTRETWFSEPLDQGRPGFCLKPLTVKTFGRWLFQYGRRVVLMSATILDAEKLAESLGIPPRELAFVSAPSSFPKENRIVRAGTLNMTKDWEKRSDGPEMVSLVQSLMEMNSDVKGLILTPSDKMLKYIQDRLSRTQAARLIIAKGTNREEEYDRHCEAKGPTVLAASGYWEGADLKGDRSRFQIIPAAPRPCWKGQVAARGDADKRWYRMKTYAKLMQGCGRSVRSESDFCETFCLDRDLRKEARASDTLLPAWFREAIVFVG